MDFGNVIFAIAIIVYIFVTIAKRAGKNKNSDNAQEPTQKKGLSLKLHNFIKEIKDEMERAVLEEKNKQKPSASFWDTDAGVEEELYETDLEFEQVEPIYKASKKVNQKPKRQPEPEIEIEARSLKIQSGTLTRQTLRNAVVMSEILATPVALRKDS